MDVSRKVVVARVSGGVGTILLDHPERLNAVTVALAEQLRAAVVSLAQRDDVRVLLVRGAGGNLCAGGDVDEVLRLRAQGAAALRTLFDAFGDALAAIASTRQPVVVAVEGVAMAGGFELMQTADIVLLHERARIRDNHIRLDLIPGGGSTQRLPHLIGRQQAMAYLLTGDTLSPQDALRMGLAHRVYAASDFEDGVAHLVATIAERDPAAVAAIKRLVGLTSPALADGLSAERTAVVEHLCGPAGDRLSGFADARQGAGADRQVPASTAHQYETE